ncbi:MAG TPA: hypothetical protein VNE38_03270 [Ktedonobacteraceae bacterium]|nr:hypothetical protein [Ktedonobacteraceae bacterium]
MGVSSLIAYTAGLHSLLISTDEIVELLHRLEEHTPRETQTLKK